MTQFIGLDPASIKSAEGVQRDLTDLVHEVCGPEAAAAWVSLPQATLARVISRNYTGRPELIRAAKVMAEALERHKSAGCRESFLFEGELLRTALKKAGEMPLDSEGE